MGIESSGLDEMVAKMGADLTAIAQEEWQTVGDVFYDRTQEAVHEITSALKNSATLKVIPLTSNVVVAEVQYGGGAVDYAEFERRRGAEHDFFTGPYVASEKDFEAAVERVFDRTAGDG